MTERDRRPPRGLPGLLPDGETMVWQGSPAWRSIAWHCCHLRELAIYFAALLAWYGAAAAWRGAPLGATAVATMRLAALALLALGLLALFAYLIHRTTIYTITDRRVVMAFGIALPISLNLPFAAIEQAGLRLHADGSGDIPLAVTPGKGLGYVVMWPHVRPWHVSRAQPMLRGVQQADWVAQVLGRGLAAAAAQPPQPAAWVGTPAAAGDLPHAAAA